MLSSTVGAFSMLFSIYRHEGMLCVYVKNNYQFYTDSLYNFGSLNRDVKYWRNTIDFIAINVLDSSSIDGVLVLKQREIAPWLSVRLWSYFSFQPVLHNWCNKDRWICYPLCGMVHIKEPFLLVGKSSSCRGSSGFPLSLSDWFFTIRPTPHNHK